MSSNDIPRTLTNISLKESLVRLSVSPVKADRDAIARLERETGKAIQTIIADLDSTDITLKALEEKPAPKYRELIERIKRGLFFGAMLGLLALFMLPENRFAIAIVLGVLLGLSAPLGRR